METEETVTKKRGRGRPRNVDRGLGAPGRAFSAWLSAEDAEWLETFGSTDSARLRELLDRARKMWPKGA